MKTPVIILLLITLMGSQYAEAQVKSGNFSDWNVPPPLPPGTMAKGVVPHKTTLIMPLTDLPPVSLPHTEQVKLAQLPPVTLTPPAVPAPYEPAFPVTPTALPDMPVPLTPEAINLPQNIPPDQLTKVSTDMSDPPDPAMPDLPKTPDITSAKFPDTPTPLPVMPGVPQQPVPAMPPDIFPFTEWQIPSIPLAVRLVPKLPQSPSR
jgi:hypothetical protein